MAGAPAERKGFMRLTKIMGVALIGASANLLAWFFALPVIFFDGIDRWAERKLKKLHDA